MKFHLISDLSQDSLRFLAMANHRSEWIWPVYIKIFMGGVFIDKVVSCSTSAIFCWIKYETFNSKCLYRPYKTM